MVAERIGGMETVTYSISTCFSGGGGVECGAKAAGFTPLRAVEGDPSDMTTSEAIADVYRRNLGDHILVMPVQIVDWRKEERPDIFHASPVCTEFSVAKSGGKESAMDIECADAVANAIRILRPKCFTLENVRKYQRSESLARIRRALSECGYEWTEEIINAASFGVPQTRIRLILRAVLGGRVPSLYPTHQENPLPMGLFEDVPLTPKWIGWYAAIEDLIPSLQPSRFADWQLKRLPEDICTFLMESKFQGRNQKELYRVGDAVTGTVTALDPNWKGFLMGVNGENSEGRAQVPPAPVIAANHPAGKYRAFIADQLNYGREQSIRQTDDPIWTIPIHSPKHPAPRAFIVSDQGSGSGETEGISVRNADTPCLTIDTRQASKTKAFLVDGKPFNFKGDLAIAASSSETMTLTGTQSQHPFRAWLEQGRVVSMTPRALARFQSIPDWYVLPDKNTLCCKIIGNAVPSLLYQRIAESLREVL